MKQKILNLSMLLLCMIVGLGSAWAEEVTGTLIFGTTTSNSSNVNITEKNQEGYDNLGNKWTITTVGTSSFTGQSGYVQVGSSAQPATSITFSTTLPETVTITSMSAQFGGFKGTAGNVILKVGDESVGTGKLNTTSDVEVKSSSSATGETLTVTVTGIAKGVKCYNISYTYQSKDGTDTPPATDGYSYTLGNHDHGSFKVLNGTSIINEGASVENGTMLNITPIPDEGYKVVSFTINDGEDHVYEGADPTDKTIESDWVISGIFEKDNSGEVEPTDPDQPDTPTGNVFFYESFNTNDGTGGNDNLWGGTIASNNIKYDNEGWDVASGSGANQCAKFGAGSAQGSATTPAIDFKGATSATLTFKAAAWNGTKEQTTLNVSAEKATLSISSVTLKKGEWTDYTIDITNVTGPVNIKFEAAQASNNRFFLDEVKIVGEGSNEPSVDPEPDPTRVINFVATNDKSNYWATFSSTENVVLPLEVILDEANADFATLTVYTVWALNGKLSLEEMETKSEVGAEGDGWYLPANHGYLLKSESTKEGQHSYSYEIGNDDTFNGIYSKTLDGNMLVPSSESMTDSSCKYYKLTYKDGKNLGFYYGNEDGAPFTGLNPNTAYLKVPSEYQVKSFTLDDLTTAIKELENRIDTTAPLYNVAGQRVTSATKGIYIQNGKKIYVK